MVVSAETFGQALRVRRCARCLIDGHVTSLPASRHLAVGTPCCIAQAGSRPAGLTHTAARFVCNTLAHMSRCRTRAKKQAASKRWKQARCRPWVVSRTHFSMLNTGRCQHLLFGMGLPLEGKLEAKARGFDTAVSTVRTRDFGRMMNRAGQDSFGLRIAEPNVAHTWAEARLLLFVLLFGFVLLFQTCGRSSAIPYLRRLTLLVPRIGSASASIHRVLPGLPSTLGPNSLH